MFPASVNYGDIPEETLRQWASVDHLTPVSRGGTNEEENLITACRRCNGLKKDRTLDEYRSWCSHRHNGHGLAADKLEESLALSRSPFDDTIREAIKWLLAERPAIQFWGEYDEEAAA
jgi:hypothetical protein